MPYGAIFDMDGTLLDSMGVAVNILTDFLALYGHKPTPEIFTDLVKMSLMESVAYLKKLYNLDEPLEYIGKKFCDHMHSEYNKHVKVKRDALSFLKKLKAAGFEMCIATANNPIITKHTLESLGIDGFFSHILITENSGHKDDPEIFHEALRLMGTTPQQTTMFEDALYSMKMAKQIGLHVVAIQDDYNEKDDEEIRTVADQYVINYEEVSIERMMEAR